MKRMICGLWGVVCLLSAGAQAPQLINYQGRLLNGTNLVNGSVGLSLRLFDASASGTLLCEDSNTVAVADGLYSTFIGDNPTSGSLIGALTNAQVWVEVAVNGVALSPRERVGASLFSLMAGGVTNGAIATAMLANGAVTGGKLAAGSITSVALADGAVTSSDLASNAVTTANIAPDAVTAAKILQVADVSLSGAAVTNPTPAGNDFFGSAATAVGSGWFAVGAEADDLGAADAGGVYVFTTAGALQAVITNPAPVTGDAFGRYLATVGDGFFAASVPSFDQPTNDSGIVYLYAFNGTLVTTVTNPTPAPLDEFGRAIAGVGPGWLGVGAPGEDAGAGNAGAMYLYDGGGSIITTVTNPRPSAGSQFGSAIAGISSNRIVVGAPNDSTGASLSGLVHLFDQLGGYLLTVTNPTPAANDFFGSAVVAVGSDRFAVAARADDTGATNAGCVYLFDLGGTLLTTITNPTPAAEDGFGETLAAVAPDRFLVGVSQDDTAGTDAGIAYLYNSQGRLLATVSNPLVFANVNDNFGRALAGLPNGRILVGMPGGDLGAANAGQAYMFDVLGTHGDGLYAEGVKPSGIVASMLASQSVTTASLATGAVTSTRIAAGAVTGTHLATGIVTSSHLVTGAVTSATIADGTISNTDIAANAGITGNKLAAGTISNAQLAVGSVTASKLVQGPGSGINADMVDGFHAADFLPVAGGNVTGTLDVDGLATFSDSVRIRVGGVTFPDDSVQTTAYTGVSGLLPWQVVAGTSVIAQANNGYVLTNANLVTVRLPGSAPVGAIVRVVGLGSGGWLVVSNGTPATNDAITWIPRSAPVKAWNAAASSADGVKLIAADNDPGPFYTSSDAGTNWTLRAPTGTWMSIASSHDGFSLVAVDSDQGNGGRIYTSVDAGANWSPRDTNRNWSACASASNGVKLVAVVNGGFIYTSTNAGVAWTARDASRAWKDVASSADGTKLVAVVNGGFIYTSTDSGVSWNPRENARSWSSIASSSDGTKLVATVSGGQVYTSIDAGLNWTPRDTARAWVDVASSADGTRLIAAVNGSTLFISSDSGANWLPTDTTRTWGSVASSADGLKLLAGVNNGLLYTAQLFPLPVGSWSGTQGSIVELLHVGNNRFIQLSHEGTVSAQ